MGVSTKERKEERVKIKDKGRCDNSKKILWKRNRGKRIKKTGEQRKVGRCMSEVEQSVVVSHFSSLSNFGSCCL